MTGDFNKLNLMYLNITDAVTMKEPTYSKIRNEVEFLLSKMIEHGRIDINKEHTFFVSTIYGGASVTLIPKAYH